jgi:hypothetical protein
MAFLTKKRDYFLLIDEDLDVVTFSGSERTTLKNIIETERR